MNAFTPTPYPTCCALLRAALQLFIRPEGSLQSEVQRCTDCSKIKSWVVNGNEHSIFRVYPDQGSY